MAEITEDFDGTLRLHLTVTEPMVRLLADMITQYIENSDAMTDEEGDAIEPDDLRLARVLQEQMDALLAAPARDNG